MLTLDNIISGLLHQDSNSFVHENYNNIHIYEEYDKINFIYNINPDCMRFSDMILYLLNISNRLNVSVSKSKKFREILDFKYEPDFYFVYDKHASRYTFIQTFPTIVLNKSIDIFNKIIDLNDKKLNDKMFSAILLLFGDVQPFKNGKCYIIDGLYEFLECEYMYRHTNCPHSLIDIFLNAITPKSWNVTSTQSGRIIIVPDNQENMKEYYDFDETTLMTVHKIVEFDSAHHLEDHPAKCYNLHGGHYVLDVGIRGYVNKYTGMVIDYTYLKKILTEIVTNKYDHHYLNGVEESLAYRSTTENIAKTIWKNLSKTIPNIYSIKLYETETSYVEIDQNTINN